MQPHCLHAIVFFVCFLACSCFCLIFLFVIINGCLFRPSIRLVPSKRTTDVDRMQAQSVMGKQKVVPPSRHSLLSHLSVAHISAAAGNESACSLFFCFVLCFFFQFTSISTDLGNYFPRCFYTQNNTGI